MKQKNLRLNKFNLSKLVYAFLIIVSLPIDLVVAKRLDQTIDRWLPSWLGLPLVFLVAVVIGVGSYLLYLWQIESLTKK